MRGRDAITQHFMARCTMPDDLWASSSTANEYSLSLWLRFPKRQRGAGNTGYWSFTYTGDSAGISHEYIWITIGDPYWYNGDQRIRLRYSGYNGSPQYTDADALGLAKTFSDGKWHHLAGTGDLGGGPNSGAQNLYLDGRLIASATYSSGARKHTNGQILIGCFAAANNTPTASGHNRSAEVGDLAVWDKTLSPSQIAELASGRTIARFTQPADLHFNWRDFRNTTPEIGPSGSWTLDSLPAPGPYIEETIYVPEGATADAALLTEQMIEAVAGQDAATIVHVPEQLIDVVAGQDVVNPVEITEQLIDVAAGGDASNPVRLSEQIVDVVAGESAPQIAHVTEHLLEVAAGLDVVIIPDTGEDDDPNAGAGLVVIGDGTLNIKERYGRRLSDESGEISYLICNAQNDIIARNLLIATAPPLHGTLQLIDTEVEELEGVPAYIGTATYGTEEDAASSGGSPVGTSSYSFDTTGGTQHITQSLETIGRFAAAGQAADFKGAIGVTDSGVEGADIIVPVFSFSETHTLAAETVNGAYRAKIFDLTGKTNNALFKTLAAGECLFMGAMGTTNSEGNWEITYLFAGSPNLSGLSVGDIAGVDKKGWEYLWIRYQEATDDTAKLLIRKPVSAYVERVYEEGDMSQLGIGT